MDPCDITRIEDEVLEFLLTRNRNPNEVVGKSDKETAPGAGSRDKDTGVDEVQGLGGGVCIRAHHECKWRTKTCMESLEEVVNGRSSPTQGLKHSSASVSTGGPLQRYMQRKVASSKATKSSKPRTYVVELAIQVLEI